MFTLTYKFPTVSVYIMSDKTFSDLRFVFTTLRNRGGAGGARFHKMPTSTQRCFNMLLGFIISLSLLHFFFLFNLDIIPFCDPCVGFMFWFNHCEGINKIAT